MRRFLTVEVVLKCDYEKDSYIIICKNIKVVTHFFIILKKVNGINKTIKLN